MAWSLCSKLTFHKIFLIESCINFKVCHPTKLENPVLLDESVVPRTKYGMALILNFIFTGINTEQIYLLVVRYPLFVKSDNSL
jgi:hypothetical protein